MLFPTCLPASGCEQQPGAKDPTMSLASEILSVVEKRLEPILEPELHSLLFDSSKTCSIDNDDGSTTTRQRQTILNLYRPGDGITPHIDLPDRYGDGIVGVCLTGGAVMDFDKPSPTPAFDPPSSEDNDDDSLWGSDSVESSGDQTCQISQDANHYSCYLPPGTVYAMTGESRWLWTHGIAYRNTDVVYDEEVGTRASSNIAQPTCGHQQPRSSTIIMRGVRVSLTFRWLRPGGNVLKDLEGGSDWNRR